MGKCKICYGVDVVRHCTFSTVVIHLFAEVVIVSKISIKCFTESASHRDWWRHREDDVIHLSPPSPAPHPLVQFPLIMAVCRPGIQEFPHIRSADGGGVLLVWAAVAKVAVA